MSIITQISVLSILSQQTTGDKEMISDIKLL